MSQSPIRWEQDDDGIVTLILDAPGRNANTMTDEHRDAMEAALDKLNDEKDWIAGVVLTSAKKTFFAGGNLEHLSQVNDDTSAEFAASIGKVKAGLRRLETLGRPVVAAINGAALGGGLEIALATHHRIALSDPKVQIGLPEVTLGLLPGAGGIARVVRMLGVEEALTKVMMDGDRFDPQTALELGLIDALVDEAEELIPAAKAWIKANPNAVQPWDTAGYTIPGGRPTDPHLASALPYFASNLRKQLKGGSLPALHHIMAAAVEGALVDFDSALVIEGRYFVNLVKSQTASNITQATWFDLRSVRSGATRPPGYERQPLQRVSIHGAGEFGAEIAAMSVRVGIEVVLEDDTTDMGNLTQVDLAIVVMAANGASAHAISGVTLPADAVGMYFHSPVDGSSLVEIVRDERTPDSTLARAFDYAAQINKLAIVVGSTPGLFTPRIARAFISEAVSLLADGVHPASIEQSATQAGYPAGGLHRADDLGLAECIAFRDEVKTAVESRGGTYVAHPAEAVFERMVELGRVGRAKGAGFYDYDPSGNPVALWPGLAEHFPVQGDPADTDLQALSERQLMIGSVEAARCIENGVIGDAAEANIGSIHGSGSPLWTGGVLQYINGFPGGVAGFVSRADELAAKHGSRFSPNTLLRTKALQAETF